MPRFSPGSSVLYFDNEAYKKIVQLSAKSASLIHGTLAHCHIIKTGFKPCLHLVNNLLDMYLKCGDMCTAHKLFIKMPQRDVISYNLMISGFSKMGLYGHAVGMFSEARKACLKLDKFTYAGLLSVCGGTGDFELGRVIHGMAVISGLEWNVFMTNLFISMYCKCRRVDQARLLFEGCKEVDIVSWNSLIGGYVRFGAYEEMWKLLVMMHQRGLSLDSHTLGSVLKGCSANCGNLVGCGNMLHGYTVKVGLDLDFVVGGALLDMYAKSGFLADAFRVFRMIPNQNVVMYNALMHGCINDENISNKCANEAFDLFIEMQRREIKPSSFTFSIMIKVCNHAEAFESGKQIHAQVYKNHVQSDDFIGSALIDLYSSMGSNLEGIKCFKLSPKRDIVSWTSMISSYIQNNQFEPAVALFYELLDSGRKPDEFIVSSILSACADLAVQRRGVQVQGYAIKTGIGNFITVQNALICMHAKCGDIDSAQMAFEETKNPSVVTWSVMICSNAQHGRAKDALRLFELMKCDGVAPNHITFLGVLIACSYGGLVNEGLEYFESMKKDYGIKACVRHCVSVADLLSRAGKLVEAEDFILNSGFEGNPVIWKALLSACRVHNNTTVGKRVAEKLIKLEPEAASSYVLLSEIYSYAGIELPATEIRELMQARGVRKEPGLSRIEVHKESYLSQETLARNFTRHDL